MMTLFTQRLRPALRSVLTGLLLLCFSAHAEDAPASASQNAAAPVATGVQKLVTVCYVPWWVNWRLPDPTIGGLPLEMINPDSGNAPGYKERAYTNTIRAFERAGIDTVCWDTFGEPQIKMAGDFLKVCKTLNTPLRLVPLMDVHEATKPNIDNVIKRFVKLLGQYRAIPEYEAFHQQPYLWIWGSRNLKPDAWQAIFKGLPKEDADALWVGHFDKTDLLAEYAQTFTGMYSWQPKQLGDITPFETQWKRTVRSLSAPSIQISPIYLMFRRYGYGFNYVDPVGFQVFHKTWQEALRNNAQWVHITTWNDYDEFTMFEPEVSRGYCLADLNAFYARVWKALPASVEPERNRIFLAYPRGTNLGEEGYLDLTGIYRSDSLPATIHVRLRNSDGVFFDAGTVRVTAPGVQSSLLKFTITKAHGSALQPVLDATWKDGSKQTLNAEFPWMDLYDPGLLRERNVWMYEAGTQIPATTVRVEAANPASDYADGMLPKRALLRITVEGNTALDYLVIKCNEQQSAVIQNGVAYVPARHFGGNFGWEPYAKIQIEEQSAQKLVFTVLEPPSRYGLTVHSGVAALANPKKNQDLTGFGRDWLTALAVDTEHRRSFSAPLVLQRGNPDATIVRYESITPDGNGYLLDDTGKGLDLKDWRNAKLTIREQSGRRVLVLQPEASITLPNHILTGRSWRLDLTVSCKDRAPVALLSSQQLDLYLDAEGYLVARRTGYDYNKQLRMPVSIRSAQPVALNQALACSVVVTSASMELLLNGQTQGKDALPFPVQNDEATIRLGAPLAKDLLPEALQPKHPLPFSVEMERLAVTVLLP